MKQSRMRRSALVLAASLGCLSAALAAEGPIKIGSFLSVTGPAAFLGDPELKTLQLYVDKLNAAGGVLGRKLELVHYDDAGDAAKANTFVKRLLEDDKVDVIVGGTTTGGTMAAVPLVERAGVPFVSLAGAVVIIDPVKKWVFKTPHTDRMACEKVFEDVKKRGLSKVALVSETSGFGKSGREQCVAVAPKLGVEITVDETYGPKDTDMTAQLAKVKGSAAQALLVFGLGQSPAIVAKNVAQLDIKLPQYQSHGVASKEFLQLAGAAAEGVRLPASALLVADQLPGNDPQKPVVVDYTREFKAKFNEDVSTFGGHAYDGLMLAVDAIKRAGSTDKEKVRAALESTKGYVGTGGVVNMSPSDHMGLDLSAFRMLEIRNGNWTLVP
ncbi:amino acid/amide ABC transporter substrate-binding protein (HAAT family) [Plasticicumulans lactativorans]|uniref:Amino acid/amide ABC transporter substrate-binding protein (HAAT family) n=1 Tax=Plasticicumulans lactativorans TaxID=1133106 RepID=A0A4R2LPK2_9GAMM|nr:ABC transporter substrate-binding protein [Plasticicumulans lactativorans]TCO81445.1 amino acid/amide ABC transporter substrate-binding protein (HAAT family) [Plasticicumulans lactativorans]